MTEGAEKTKKDKQKPTTEEPSLPTFPFEAEMPV